MKPFTKREKKLSGIIAVLVLLVIFLSFKIVDYNIKYFAVGGEVYDGPPSMEDSIKKASMILYCKLEVHGDTAKYKIDEIIYKNKKYEFPYSMGDFFPKLERTMKQGTYYGEGQLVILSAHGPTVFRSLQVMRGQIPAYDNIGIDKLIEMVNTIKN